MNNDKWNDGGKWLKGNIHTHTLNSDGVCSVEKIASLYGRHGFDFVFLTDHYTRTVPPKGIRRPLLIPAEEIDFTYKKRTYHFVCLGLKKAWTKEYVRNHSPAQIIERAEREGVFLVNAHPYWCGTPSHDCVHARGSICPGIEVYNTVCDQMIGKGYSSVHWDDLLDSGHRPFGFAVDDTHGKNNVAGGWIMVKAESPTETGILEAIGSGNFYASQGPVIESLSAAGRKIRVKCSAAARINFITNRSGGCSCFSGKKPLTEASWTAPESSSYVRIEITDKRGKIAWSNPLFI